MNKLLNARHELYNELREQERFMLQSYCGGKVYANTNNLFRYINENKDKYANRLKRSYLVNYLQPVISETKNSVFAEQIQRDAAQKEVFARFIENATKTNKTLNEFMQDLAIYGSLLKVGVLVDGAPANGVYTKNDVEKYRLYASVRILLPHQILDWCENENGKIEWVYLDCSYRDKSKFGTVQTVRKYVLWTADRFIVYLFDDDSQTPETEEVEHNLGEVPFFFFTKRDINQDSLARPMYEDIAIMQRAIYNYMSLIDEDVYSSIMPMLLCKVSQNPFNQENKQGTGFSLTDNTFYYEEVPPQLLKTDFLNPQTLLIIIENLQKEIFRRVGKYLDANNMYAQSGVAKEIDNQQRSNNLANFAKQLENCENNILRLFALWQGVEFTDYDKSVYPQVFDMTSLAEKINEAIQMNSLFGNSQTAQNAIKKDILVSKFADKLTEEEREQIELELKNPQPDFE